MRLMPFCLLTLVASLMLSTGCVSSTPDYVKKLVQRDKRGNKRIVATAKIGLLSSGLVRIGEETIRRERLPSRLKSDGIRAEAIILVELQAGVSGSALEDIKERLFSSGYRNTRFVTARRVEAITDPTPRGR